MASIRFFFSRHSQGSLNCASFSCAALYGSDVGWCTPVYTFTGAPDTPARVAHVLRTCNYAKRAAMRRTSQTETSQANTSQAKPAAKASPAKREQVRSCMHRHPTFGGDFQFCVVHLASCCQRPIFSNFRYDEWLLGRRRRFVKCLCIWQSRQAVPRLHKFYA